MCRIAGIIDPTSANLVHDICVMRDSMTHGGPDGEGVYIDKELPLAFGHRRLSLLDLSDAGHQPMNDLDGQLQIIFNGEIYNFLDLKKELITFGYSFKTTCDTEVILKAYVQWGKNCFSRFNGMFALSIFDKRTSQLILARDHAGMKPLYYCIRGNKLHFASEVRAFKSLYPDWKEDDNWKTYFLTFGYLPEPKTTLAGVTSLKKGTVAIIELPSLTIREETFAKFVFQPSITSISEATGLIREMLDNSVQRHLISDAPIGLFLSGGIDSSLLTLLAHKTLKDNLHTISIVFEDEKFSEAKYQKIIIDKTGAKHSSCLVTEDEFSSSLPDILKAMDQPSIDGINAYFICKYASKFGLKAVLSGIGADELFGGYDSFYRTDKVRLLKKLPAQIIGLSKFFTEQRKKKVAFLKRKDFLGDYLFNRGLYTPEETASILDCTVNDITSKLNAVDFGGDNKNLDDRDAVSWGEQNIYMQSQLLKDTDYMGMWHSLEVRLPFLDKELMKAVYSIAPQIKYNPTQKKHLLIKAFEDVLPNEIYNRKKQGFTFPFEKWIIPVQTTEQHQAAFAKKHDQFKAGKLQWVHYWAYLLACNRSTIKYYARNTQKILFLNLDAFQFTGGIEKFNRAFLMALSILESEGKVIAKSLSAYDSKIDSRYFNRNSYKGFNGNRVKFVFEVWKSASRYDTIIIGHINLAFAAWGIKKMYPEKKIILIAHGIEVWEKLRGVKDFLIKSANEILAVSNYTKEAMIEIHGIDANKISIFHNTIDPYFSYPTKFKKPEYLMKRYGIDADVPVIFTLTRLSSSEKYKGYDKLLEVLPYLKNCVPDVKYILSGKADEGESKRLQALQQVNNLLDTVLLTGFIKDEEVVDHFLLADVFVMPSRKEGFGIVFIEAMACGLPVIAGNKDGSVDALQNGLLGQLVDPDSDAEMFQAVVNTLQREQPVVDVNFKKELQQKVKDTFGFDVYKKNLEKILV